MLDRYSSISLSSARSRHWHFFSIGVTHCERCSRADIDPKGLETLASTSAKRSYLPFSFGDSRAGPGQELPVVVTFHCLGVVAPAMRVARATELAIVRLAEQLYDGLQ